jgi:alpha-D-ribose 1-methylphosphonate 5-triphosphate diphosphatase
MQSEHHETRGLLVRGGQCLVAKEGLVEVDIRCRDGKITEIGASLPTGSDEIAEARGCLVLPGIVDIHGDAFERQMMPRPNTLFPLDIAMLDTDRQLAMNGITTAFHGITVSWEPGLRSLQQAMAIVKTIDDNEPHSLVDHRVHIRWETFAVDQVDDVIALFLRSKKPLLSFNDHTSPTMAGARTETKIRGSADRAFMDIKPYLALLDSAWERRGAVPAAIAAVSRVARNQNIAMLSHDDRSPMERQSYREVGAHIAEFPMNWETAREAALAGEDIVLGAPNVVRGGSHNGAVSAEEAIADGACSILASDYYYPAPLLAALALVSRGVLPMAQAWALVAATPARACGLHDRGEIAVGLRADLIVLPNKQQRPSLTIVAGEIAVRSKTPR